MRDAEHASSARGAGVDDLLTSAALTTATATATPRAFTTAPREEAPIVYSVLAPKYREVLAKNPALQGVSLEKIQIEQIGGHVILRGYLPTVADKVQVELAIRQLKDVTSVTNDIRLLR